MLFIPLPFVVALLLLLLLARVISEGGKAALLRPFFILTGGYALLSAIIGLRWGYHMTGLLPVMSIMAASLSSLAWIAFQGLTSTHRSSGRGLIHILPTLLVAIQIIAWPQLIDWFLAAIYLSYGTALLWLAARGPDALDRVPLENTILVHRSLVVAGVMLVLSAIVDGLISIDFARAGGIHAANYVSAANLLVLLILGTAAAIAGSSPSPDTSEDSAELSPLLPNEEDFKVAAKVENLIIEKQLYRDPELTLNRLSRKALIPARRISAAINRTKQQNVSQYVNGYRVAEACKLLSETDRSITAIMFEAGFQTKSNFNREFLRQTGKSPADWRAKNTKAVPSSPTREGS